MKLGQLLLGLVENPIKKGDEALIASLKANRTANLAKADAYVASGAVSGQAALLKVAVEEAQNIPALKAVIAIDPSLLTEVESFISQGVGSQGEQTVDEFLAKEYDELVAWLEKEDTNIP